MTLYTYSLPLPLVVRIFDSFLWEGWKVISLLPMAASVRVKKNGAGKKKHHH